MLCLTTTISRNITFIDRPLICLAIRREEEEERPCTWPPMER